MNKQIDTGFGLSFSVEDNNNMEFKNSFAGKDTIVCRNGSKMDVTGYETELDYRMFTSTCYNEEINNDN